MSELEPSLRRFADLRHQRRQTKSSAIEAPQGDAVAPESIVRFTIRATLSQRIYQSLITTQALFQLPRNRLVAQVLEWFLSQPHTVQAVVLARSGAPAQADLAALLQQRLPAPGAVPPR